jgi:hypothetical protein
LDAGTVVNVATGTAQDAATDGVTVTSNEDTVTVTAGILPGPAIAVPTLGWRGLLVLIMLMLFTGLHLRPGVMRR